MKPPQTPGKCKHLTGNQTLGGLPVLLNSMCKSSTEQALNKTRATEGVSVDVSESTLNGNSFTKLYKHY